MINMARSKLIDCEGIEAKKLNLIKNGRLQFYFNSLARPNKFAKNQQDTDQDLFPLYQVHLIQTFTWRMV